MLPSQQGSRDWLGKVRMMVQVLAQAVENTKGYSN
jgi:hypothetical protein